MWLSWRERTRSYILVSQEVCLWLLISFWLETPALGCNKIQINDEEKFVNLKFNRAALAALFAAAGIMSAHAQIFEANEGVGTIGEYDATTGALIGTPITGLNTPTGLALAGSNLVVANYNGPTGGNSGSVAEYTTSGQAVSGFSPITGLPQPISVSVSGSDLFVATNGAGNGGAIGEYDARTGAAVNARSSGA
jgi:hypothetical protein